MARCSLAALASPLASSGFLAFLVRCVPAPRWLWRLPVAWRSSSPTTFYPCELSRSSPDALCVCRRLLEGPEEATPSLRRLAWQARKFNGPPPLEPRPTLDSAPQYRLRFFEHRPRG